MFNRLNLTIWLLLWLVLTGCRADRAPTPLVQQPSVTSTAKPPATPTRTATASPSPTPTATPSPTITPTPTQTPTPTITPTPTPHPMAPYTIEGLRERDYSGGTIRLRSVLTVTEVFTRHYIDYPSDELTITGVMQTPRNPQFQPPFPVVILNHGYIPPGRYWSGADTWKAAEYLNGQGYLTVAPDFRGWGGSDVSHNFFRTGLLIDALNLVGALDSLPQADSGRVGMWGHSMGGGVTTKALTVDPRLKAAVLYAPVSGFDAEVLARWGPGVRPDLEERLVQAYADAVFNPAFLERTSPINHFHFVSAPVQIHIGSADTSTPPEWSKAIYEALQAANKEVDYFVYPGQGHAFQGENWTLFMQRVTDFFDRHLQNSSG